jgi:hypothetical protein
MKRIGKGKILLVFIWIPLVLSSAEKPLVKSNINYYLFDQVIIICSTNINQFHLKYREDNYIAFNNVDTSLTNRLKISIPAANIETESNLMLHDFLQLINAQQYPYIDISMQDNFTHEILSSSEKMNYRVKITLNGRSNFYNCVSEFTDCGEEKCLVGKLKINLTDFALEPPRKFYGLIRVADEVFIKFRIIFLLDQKEI